MALKFSKGYTVHGSELPPSDDAEVFAFTPSVLFTPNDKRGDPFRVGRGTWEKLGKPPMIRVTVQALEKEDPTHTKEK